MSLPTGTVTFLFTDMEGSTRLWRDDHGRMSRAQASHDALLRQVVARHGGVVFKTAGDSACAAFPTAAGAAAAAIEGQLGLASSADTTGIAVRMVLCTGEAEARDGDYFGLVLSRAARLVRAAHGGQILAAGTTALLLRDSLSPPATLRDLGRCRLKDLHDAEHVWQLVHPDLPSEFPPLAALDAVPNNLPLLLTSFIGRERELAQIQEMLRSGRMVTLTGAGGCGKTRLALQAAAHLAVSFPDGAWLVELAALSDGALLPAAAAAALGAAIPAGSDPASALLEWAAGRELLLLLDNCEHLLEDCASLAESLLRRCPRVRILATSREPLQIAGERRCRVPSLSLPDDPGDWRLLAESESGRLFQERARAASEGFAITPENAAAVASICRRLDGIPLAIELAASRIGMLTPQEVDKRLGDRFRLLRGGPRTVLPRQQTLHAAIEWSYDLLSEPERKLLARLSVFASGWTVEAAEVVCSDDVLDEHSILDLLERLCDKSLVVVDPGSQGGSRQRLLESIREYAAERLGEAGEVEALRQRHRDWFLRLAEQAAPRLQQPEQKLWLDRLDADHDNLRAAFAWSVEPEVRLRLCVALHRFWLVRGHYAEGRGRLEGTLARAGQASELHRARGHNALGILAWASADYAAAREEFSASLALFEEMGDRDQQARQRANLGIIAFSMGEFAEARENLTRSLAVFRELGDWGPAAMVTCNLGALEREAGSLAAARPLLEESAALFRSQGDKASLATAVHNLAGVALREGNPEGALEPLREALQLLRDLGDPRGLVLAVDTLGQALALQGRDQEAAEALIAAECLARRHGVPFSAPEADEHASVLAAIASRLGPADLAAVQDRAQALTLEQASRLAEASKRT